jgi:hypothetical protein
MGANFQVALKRSKGNLHVVPRGDFDGSSACELVNLLHEQYDGKGCVFIDTDNLRDICPFGCSTFQCRLNQHRVPANRIFFKGENGLKIAPCGSKVMVFGKEQSGYSKEKRHAYVSCKDQLKKSIPNDEDAGKGKILTGY